MTVNRNFAALALVVLIVVEVCGQSASSVPQDGDDDADANRWSFAAGVYGYLVPDDQSYFSPTFRADHKRLHLEARYNYEDRRTGSLWAGYNLSFGDKLLFEVTPMVGGIFGNTTGIAPGYELSLTYWKIALYSEGEFVFDTKDQSANFFYSWNELTYAPTDWLRAGLASQRTRAYHTPLDVQRGVLIGFSHNKVDFTTYVFNAGWTDPTVVLALGFKF
jgi:hypothetical protein